MGTGMKKTKIQNNIYQITGLRPFAAFFFAASVLTVSIMNLYAGCQTKQLHQTKSGWEQADEILSRIKAPKFPDKDFIVTDFGAVSGGAKDCTDAFKKAITAASEAGGGRVIVPAGNFLSGAIHLKSNVNLHISEGAVIKFSTNPDMYLPEVYTRWEGVECMNYSPLIYAYEQENIAITGKGTLDGQGSDDNWWQWKKTQAPDRQYLFLQGEKGEPVEQRQFG